MKTFTDEPLDQITSYLQQNLKEKKRISFYVLNPDHLENCYSGTTVLLGGRSYIHRSFKSYLEIADFYKLRFCTPKIKGDLVQLTYEKIDTKDSFHQENTNKEDKYGKNSLFFQINKNEEASYYLYFRQALQQANLEQKSSVLNLGVNKADEFEVIKKLHPNSNSLSLTGIDYCQSAVEYAQEKFKDSTFYIHDINCLDSLALKRFDLVVSITTLQSPQIDFDKTIKYITKNLISDNGSIILGFPNSRWIDGELFYGAKPKNYSFNELSLLYKDVTFAKRYLQQQNFRVMITGKDYIFVTANKLKA